jgi:hypothetical protein
VFGAELSGRVLAFQPTGDPPGAWAFTRGEATLAELLWSREERAVRIDALGDVWRARFAGGHVLDGVIEAPDGSPRLLYGGGLSTGVALSRRGAPYELFVASDWRRGRWSGVDDVEGEGVLRATFRLGSDGLGSEVRLSPEPRHREDLWPLLFLWGGLRVFGQGRPFFRLLSLRVSRRAAERALHRLLASLAAGDRGGDGPG